MYFHERAPQREQKIEAKKERIAQFLEKHPRAGLVLALVFSAVGHAGTVYREEVATFAREVPEDAKDGVEDIVRRTRQTYEQFRGGTEEAEQVIATAQELAAAPEKEKHFDLSDFYFASEEALGGFTHEEIERAKRNYDRLVDGFRALRASGGTKEEVLNAVLAEQGRYHLHQPFLTEMLEDTDLTKRKANCEGRAKFIAAVVQDVFPELVEDGALVMQQYGDIVDSNGKYLEPHIRTALNEGEALLILEGEKVRYEKKDLTTAPYYEARMLASTSLLAGQDLYVYDFDDASDELKAARREHGLRDSFLRFPPSTVVYKDTRGMTDVVPDIEDTPVESTGIFSLPIDAKVLQDAQAQQQAEREKKEQAELARMREIFRKDLEARGIRYDSSISHQGKFDLTSSPEIQPLRYEDIQKWQILYPNAWIFSINLSTRQELSRVVLDYLDEEFYSTTEIAFSAVEKPYSSLFLESPDVGFIGSLDFMEDVKNMHIPKKHGIHFILSEEEKGAVQRIGGIPTEKFGLSKSYSGILCSPNLLVGSLYEGVELFIDATPEQENETLLVPFGTKDFDVTFTSQVAWKVRGEGQIMEHVEYWAVDSGMRDISLPDHAIENFSFIHRLDISGNIGPKGLQGVHAEMIIFHSGFLDKRLLDTLQVEQVVIGEPYSFQNQMQALDPSFFAHTSAKEIYFVLSAMSFDGSTIEDVSEEEMQHFFDTHYKHFLFSDKVENIFMMPRQNSYEDPDAFAGAYRVTR